MNEITTVSALVIEQSPDEKRARALVRFETHMRELALSPPLERVAELDKEFDLIEQYARDTGLFRDEEMLEFRIGRLVTRWHLGDRLAKVERRPEGGRPKTISVERVFKDVLDRIGLATRQAQEAQRIACLPPEELKAFCDRAREEDAGQLPSFGALLREARPWWYQESRKQKHQAIRNKAMLNKEALGPFPLIYSDFPWRFDVYSEKGLERTPDQHYETLSDEEIIAFKVNGKSLRDIATPAAAHFMWCTSSNQYRAMKVMEAQGFEFKTSAVWDKGVTGLGLVFRNQHEVLLYGTRGDMPGPQYQPPSVFSHPRGEHSAKPVEIREAIEKMYPDFDAATRLELFARGDIKGWTTYGYEAD